MVVVVLVLVEVEDRRATMQCGRKLCGCEWEQGWRADEVGTRLTSQCGSVKRRHTLADEGPAKGR